MSTPPGPGAGTGPATSVTWDRRGPVTTNALMPQPTGAPRCRGGRRPGQEQGVRIFQDVRPDVHRKAAAHRARAAQLSVVYRKRPERIHPPRVDAPGAARPRL